MIENISIDDLIELNKIVNDGDCKVINLHSLESCLSSYHYYDTLQEQVSSVFRSLILNHAFFDGNKRTAVMLIAALENYDEHLLIRLDDNKLYDLVIQIIKEKPNVKVIANTLYKVVKIIK